MMVVGGDPLHPDATALTAEFVSLPPWNPMFPSFVYLPVRKPVQPPHGFRSAVAYDEASKTWITVGPNGTDISTDDGSQLAASSSRPQRQRRSGRGPALECPFPSVRRRP